jgi:hypothetical protein
VLKHIVKCIIRGVLVDSNREKTAIGMTHWRVGEAFHTDTHTHAHTPRVP